MIYRIEGSLGLERYFIKLSEDVICTSLAFGLDNKIHLD